MPLATHPFDFTSTHGRTLDDLLNIGAPDAPPDFDALWRACKAATEGIPPRPRLGRLVEERDGCQVREISYDTLGGHCAALLLLPIDDPARNGFVIGHGYGGRVDAGSDLPLPLPGSAAIPPAAPGSRNSARARASLPIPPGTPCTASDPVTPTSSATAWPACGAPRPPSWNGCPLSTAGSACSAQASAATSGRSHCRGTTMCGVIRKG